MGKNERSIIRVACFVIIGTLLHLITSSNNYEHRRGYSPTLSPPEVGGGWDGTRKEVGEVPADPVDVKALASIVGIGGDKVEETRSKEVVDEAASRAAALKEAPKAAAPAAPVAPANPKAAPKAAPVKKSKKLPGRTIVLVGKKKPVPAAVAARAGGAVGTGGKAVKVGGFISKHPAVVVKPQKKKEEEGAAPKAVEKAAPQAAAVAAAKAETSRKAAPTALKKVPIPKPKKIEPQPTAAKKPPPTPMLPAAAGGVQVAKNVSNIFNEMRAEIDPKVHQFLHEKAASQRRQAANKCPVQFPAPLEPRHAPLIRLRSNYFIYATLGSGPNNQLISFRETIFLAIRLNRTVVMPWFRKHETEGRGSIDPRHRIDISKLQKFIPIVSSIDYQASCGATYGAVFRPFYMDENEYVKLNKWTGLEAPANVKELEYPKGISKESMKQLYPLPRFLYNASEVTSFYESKAKCAIYPWAFRNLRLDGKAPTGKEPTSIDVTNLSHDELYSEVIRFTPFPSHLTKLALDVARDMFKGKIFIAMHWRFDKKDWGLKCGDRTSWAQPIRRVYCEIAFNATDAELAALFGIMDRRVKTVDAERTKNIYIASPPSETALMARVEKLLAKEGYKVFFGRDIEKYLRRKYYEVAGCGWLWENFQDILSNLEMIVCQHAHVFMRSPTSSWSNNVQMMRSADVVPREYSQYDATVMTMLKYYHLEVEGKSGETGPT